jgi:hypothetical protein
MIRDLVIGAAAVLMASSALGQLNHGDIVFSRDDAGSGRFNAVLKTVSGSGQQVVISQPGVRGSGPDFGSLIGGLAIDHANNILLTGFDAESVFKIDPVTGNRAVLSGPGAGSGPTMDGPNDVVISPYGNDIFVSAGTAHSIIRVDPSTGDRSLVSGPTRGTGPALDHPAGLSRTLGGDFYVFDADIEAVYFVNGTSGDRRIVSGAGVGGGPEFNGAGFDVAVLPDGSLAVSDHTSRVLRVDSVSGERSILSSASVGSGTNLDFMEYLTVTQEGLLLGAGAVDGIELIDPASGDRTLVTDNNADAGGASGLFREAVMVTPEPSGMGVVGVAALWGVGRRKRLAGKS